jgi:DNA-binding response OmpR family regulator
VEVKPGILYRVPVRQTVLIVEDDADLRNMYRLALTFAGFDVQIVGDGLEALRRIDHDPPALVVLDLSLPSISGIVVRQEIAASAVTRDIPIVIVTGSPERAEGLDVACVLSKPVSPERLTQAVKACLAAGTGSSRR